jgi:hypothetical protein
MTLLNGRPALALALVSGVAYGLLLRAAFDWRVLDGIFEIVSYSFLVAMPFGLGALTAGLAWRSGTRDIGHLLASASIAMLVFVAAMGALFIEGVICIVLVLPVFVAAACVGALLTGLAFKFTNRGGATVGAFALLPMLLAPLEQGTVATPGVGTVRTTIEVAADPEMVWANITNVHGIKPDELGGSLMHTIGLPRPLEARMDGDGIGASRTSRWEKGVQFKETMTQWSPPHVMSYDFDIPKGSIPRDALDRHVELGGDYFTVLRGGYVIRPSGNGGSTVELWTTFHNKSRLELYGNLWAHVALDDFHGSILGLVKRRSEAAVQTVSSR